MVAPARVTPPDVKAAPEGPPSGPSRSERAGDSGSYAIRLPHDGDVLLALQRRASRNLLRHSVRAAVRFGVLALADMSALFAAWSLYARAREAGWIDHVLPGPIRVWHPLTGPPGIAQYCVALVLGLALAGTYGPGDARRDPGRQFAGCAMATGLVWWGVLWASAGDIGVLAVAYALTVPAVFGAVAVGRLVVEAVVHIVAHPVPLRTLVIGPARQPSSRRVPLFGAGEGDMVVLGRLALDDEGAPDVLGGIEDLPTVLARRRVDAVLLTGWLGEEAFARVVETVARAGVQLLSQPVRTGLSGVWPHVVWRRGEPFMQLSAPTLRARQLLAKRVFDLVASSFGVVLVSPVIALVAVLVTLDSPGPVFFRQERVGTGGRRFRVWKFRTMRHGASQEAHRALVSEMLRGDEVGTAHTAADGTRVFKLVHDDRVTRVGAWLRRYSLDELPQLFNVIVGEMSLVGPRPPLLYEVEAYDQWQLDRLGVKPGITGLWQVSGRNLLSYRQMCELDVAYVRHWSLWLDLEILVKTVPVVLFNSGRAA